MPRSWEKVQSMQIGRRADRAKRANRSVSNIQVTGEAFTLKHAFADECDFVTAVFILTNPDGGIPMAIPTSSFCPWTRASSWCFSFP